MKKTFSIIFVFVMLLTLGLSTVASAQGDDPEPFAAPQAFDSASLNPSTVPPGGTFTIELEFDLDTTGGSAYNHFCFYFSDSNFITGATWENNPTSNLGDNYGTATTSTSSATNCPNFGGYPNEVLYTVNNPTAGFISDTLTIDVGLPTGQPSAADYIVGMRQYNCANISPATCGIDDQEGATLTVQPPSSDVYVSNTSGCGGNTPCYTGPDALQNAFDDVAGGGTVNVYGTWSQGGGNTAQLTGTKSVTLTGFNAPRIENGGGTCGGAMIDNNSSGTLTVKNLTIDGTCGTGSRTAGILSSSGTTNVTDNANTIRDFTGLGNAGIDVGGGTVVVSGNSFINNEAAMEQSGGTLYAFANNVTSTTGSNAAVSTAGTSNVKCNYWGSATISGFGTDYDERLGAPAVNYAEGTGAQTLGNAALAAGTGNQVLVSMGRDTDSPPFNNGTTGGLGALVSDFFAACSSRAGTAVGAIAITGDSVTPGTDGFRLYEVQNADDCSPSDNVDCWDYAGGVDVNGDPTGSAYCTGLGCTVTDETASEGNFVVGNETDPTAITLSNLTVTSARNTWVPVALVVTSLTLVGGLFLARRRRENS